MAFHVRAGSDKHVLTDIAGPQTPFTLGHHSALCLSRRHSPRSLDCSHMPCLRPPILRSLAQRRRFRDPPQVLPGRTNCTRAGTSSSGYRSMAPAFATWYSGACHNHQGCVRETMGTGHQQPLHFRRARGCDRSEEACQRHLDECRLQCQQIWGEERLLAGRGGNAGRSCHFWWLWKRGRERMVEHDTMVCND